MRRRRSEKGLERKRGRSSEVNLAPLSRLDGFARTTL